MSDDLLASGQRPLWTPAERERLGRCPSCEHHPPTQGHHAWCPVEDTST
jgi:hypothetical protein